MVAVKAVERSANAKIGVCSATYVAQSSCPACVFKGNGCYAEGSFVGMITRKLNKEGVDATPLELAQEEAAAIGSLTGQLPLRVHVVGDCQTDEAARLVGGAMLDHTAKAAQPSWTYTHAWREVDRTSWGPVAVQASCESAADVELASQRGYASAVVVPVFLADRRYQDSGLDIIPCPEQTGRAASCVACGLCLSPTLLELRRERGVSIGFAVHGNAHLKAERALGG